MPTNSGGPIGPAGPRIGGGPRLRLSKSGATRPMSGKPLRIGGGGTAPGNAPQAQSQAPATQPAFNIQPSMQVGGPIHDPTQAQYMQNMILGQIPDFNQFLKQYDKPGVSRSEANILRASSDYGQAKAQAYGQAAQVPLQFHLANAQQMLQEQVARENETYGLGSRLGAWQDNAANAQSGILRMLLGGLGSIF